MSRVAVPKVHFLTAFLLLSAAPGGMATPEKAKDAAGCSLVENSRPIRGACADGGGGCYECFYSNDSGEWECYENIDGSIAFCRRSGGVPYTL